MSWGPWQPVRPFPELGDYVQVRGREHLTGAFISDEGVVVEVAPTYFRLDGFTTTPPGFCDTWRKWRGPEEPTRVTRKTEIEA